VLSYPQISKKFLSRTEQLEEIRIFVSNAARQFGFADEDISKIMLAVDEACTNIIKHAYQNSPDKEIDIHVIREGKTFEVRIFDNGKSFDPALLRNPDLKEYLVRHRRGGLGVYLMKKLVDDVEYNFLPGHANEVRLTKYLPGS
jgi:serine/threonine-protein kinase RsbW